jgi:hypothetical protein
MKTKFFRSGLASVIWDKERNKVLARFEEGQFVTSDARTIKLLKEAGYPTVPLNAKAPNRVLQENPVMPPEAPQKETAFDSTPQQNTADMQHAAEMKGMNQDVDLDDGGKGEKTGGRKKKTAVKKRANK